MANTPFSECGSCAKSHYRVTFARDIGTAADAGVILRIFSTGRARIFQDTGACAPRRTARRFGRARRGFLGGLVLAVLAAAFGPLLGCKSELAEQSAARSQEPRAPAPTL